MVQVRPTCAVFAALSSRADMSAQMSSSERREPGEGILGKGGQADHDVKTGQGAGLCPKQ